MGGRSVAEPDDRWPFGETDGGPLSRPIVVDLEGVLVAILADASTGERAMASLSERGYSDRQLRLYTSEQILAYEETFRTNRGLAGRVVGALVDDGESMAQYVQYAREGRAALWVLVPDRDEANRLVRLLADHAVLHIWYHGHRRLEILHMA
jgi:hypothetical protein